MRSVMKAQVASLPFTPVFAVLVAIKSWRAGINEDY